MSTYTPEQQAENRTKWVAALRSGEFDQTREVLRTDEEVPSYCCLGVACVLAIREQVELDFPDHIYTDWDEQLPESIRDWLGLYSGVGDLSEPIGTNGHLIDLNDEAKYSFAEIADVIESGGVRLAGDNS